MGRMTRSVLDRRPDDRRFSPAVVRIILDELFRLPLGTPNLSMVPRIAVSGTST